MKFLALLPTLDESQKAPIIELVTPIMSDDGLYVRTEFDSHIKWEWLS